ncbi:MAG TPA: hypothetical protein VHL34_06755 [Rhizomicrobium sp.]|jgi:2-phosphoglycerate kinase|nr:hypothetical protein [Rhizomicrobium sp.]
MAPVVMIGGTSHAGKSTLARALGAALGWEAISTDSLARHPGRPWVHGGWTAVPAHVVEHYGTLSDDALMASVLMHYRTNVWPIVTRLIAERQDGVVLEGSALLPDLVATLGGDVRAVWLTASPDFLARRIKAESSYDGADAAQRHLIERFIARTQLFDRAVMRDVRRVGLQWTDVETTPPDALLSTARRLLGV